MSEWISVKDMLPENDEYVLWRHENGYIFMECIDKDWDDDYLQYFINGHVIKESSGRITHYMPLPEPPRD